MADAQRDAQQRLRRCVYLPDDAWEWVDSTAARDGSTRSDLIEGLILLAMDDAEATFHPIADR